MTESNDMVVGLRPDGVLTIGGKADEDGALAIALAGAPGAVGESAAVAWLRRLAGDHVRRIVAASADGAMPLRLCPAAVTTTRAKCGRRAS